METTDGSLSAKIAAIATEMSSDNFDDHLGLDCYIKMSTHIVKALTAGDNQVLDAAIAGCTGEARTLLVHCIYDCASMGYTIKPSGQPVSASLFAIPVVCKGFSRIVNEGIKAGHPVFNGLSRALHNNHFVFEDSVVLFHNALYTEAALNALTYSDMRAMTADTLSAVLSNERLPVIDNNPETPITEPDLFYAVGLIMGDVTRTPFVQFSIKRDYTAFTREVMEALWLLGATDSSAEQDGIVGGPAILPVGIESGRALVRDRKILASIKKALAEEGIGSEAVTGDISFLSSKGEMLVELCAMTNQRTVYYGNYPLFESEDIGSTLERMRGQMYAMGIRPDQLSAPYSGAGYTEHMLH